MSLLVGNLIIMAVDARDVDGQHKVLRIWTQTFASPLQSASSKATGATSGFFEQIWNFTFTDPDLLVRPHSYTIMYDRAPPRTYALTQSCDPNEDTGRLVEAPPQEEGAAR